MLCVLSRTSGLRLIPIALDVVFVVSTARVCLNMVPTHKRTQSNNFVGVHVCCLADLIQVVPMSCPFLGTERIGIRYCGMVERHDVVAFEVEDEIVARAYLPRARSPRACHSHRHFQRRRRHCQRCRHQLST